MNAPLFSIIIPLYNKASHIEDTLNTVMGQTFSDFEVFVINDGSTDDGRDKVMSMNDERIKLFNIENEGVSHARNYGISKARSECIVFLDADDLWKPFHLEDLKTLYERFPNCGLYAKAYNRKSKTYEIPSRYNGIPANWIGIVDDFFEASLLNCIAWTSAAMVPKKVFDVVGNFNENYNSGEDIDLWIRIALQFPVAFQNRVSATHRLDTENKITKSSILKRKFINLNGYEEAEIENKNLKRFLDNNRYALAIQYQLEGEKETAQKHLNDIHPDHLSNSQKYLLRLPQKTLKAVLKSREKLRKLGLNLTLFR